MITVVQKSLKESAYLVFDINKLEVGSVVPFDILIKKEDNYVVIITLGTTLSTQLYNKLSKQEKLYISKKNRSISNLTCNNLEYYIELNIDLNKKVLEFLYKINAQNYNYLLEKKHNENTSICVENIVRSIIFIIKTKKHYLKDTLQYFSNIYQLDIHSLHVAIYAVNLGSLLHLNEIELLQIGIAGLLHDIGEKGITEDILLSEHKLTQEEIYIVHQHPKRSVLIAEHNYIHNPYIIDAIMHHHERYDGSGYPDQLREKQISKFATILAICDVFDALTNDRPYRKRFSYFEALKFMMKDETMKGQFNHDYLQAFLKSLL